MYTDAPTSQRRWQRRPWPKNFWPPSEDYTSGKTSRHLSHLRRRCPAQEDGEGEDGPGRKRSGRTTKRLHGCRRGLGASQRDLRKSTNNGGKPLADSSHQSLASGLQGTLLLKTGSRTLVRDDRWLIPHGLVHRRPRPGILAHCAEPHSLERAIPVSAPHDYSTACSTARILLRREAMFIAERSWRNGTAPNFSTHGRARLAGRA